MADDDSKLLIYDQLPRVMASTMKRLAQCPGTEYHEYDLHRNGTAEPQIYLSSSISVQKTSKSFFCH